MKIRVPKRITKRIEEMCREISPDRKPVYVMVDGALAAGSEEDCIENVARKMMKDGGGFQMGWAIWEWPQVMLEAEFWAVWVNPDGQWIDVTPRARGEQILFIADDTTKFEGKPIDSIVKPLIEHPLVLQYIEFNQKIWQQADELASAGATTMTVCEAIAPLLDKKEELEKEIDQKISGGVGRNDLCSCGSGKKFKNCCGH